MARAPFEWYSPSFAVARQRFREAALDIHAQVEPHPLPAPAPDGATLSCDVAWIGAREPRHVVVVTSGLHGVEGFFGSAAQLAWLGAVARGQVVVAPRTTVVLVHALNPFGFAWRRRADEANVDLNRNFLDATAGESYAGTPPGYDRVHGLLNPQTPPSRRSGLGFRLQAVVALARSGISTLGTAVASGQYDHADGLFFGGREPSAATRLVQTHWWSWTRGANRIVHLDVHTGLGTFADYQLLVDPTQQAALDWYRAHFDRPRVAAVADEGVYAARGTMAGWLTRHAGGRRYRTLTVEFGTHPMLRVLAALRAEHRTHRLCDPESRHALGAKRELVECFCPRSELWRRKALERSQIVIAQALAAVRDA